ncbi:MAG: MBOAT family protein, partial [Planctomycetes bacterium]|nr:MBOAT family protein [Planctomycetota bacterium]
MLFHTWLFALFFCIVYPVYVLTRGTWFEKPWLLLASYIFYASWNPVFLVLIIYSTVVDYAVVWRMEVSPRRGLWLALGVGNHIFLLGFFKYGGFIVENFNALFARLGLGWEIPDPNGVLSYVNFVSERINHLLAAIGIPYHLAPQTTLLIVGISFYTFQSMSYIIDCYRGIARREKQFLVYAAYVCFFPQLVAGPIERSSNLLRQLGSRRTITGEDIGDGLSLFLVGLFKKVAMADFLALYVDKVYGSPAQFGAPALILATVAFGWQVYFDFAGYTDMARGIARLMGIRLVLNFNNPYLATGFGDFWRRWHISLSSWFRDYIYIPLGGNRRGEVLTHVNMAATMVISGLWHGASWTFVIWGALHAAYRVLTRNLEATAFYRERLPDGVKRAFVFACVTFAWIF